jgi:EAL domain-containing protein (putative c-di-GMP-specific phosphodiesterase class I)
MPGGAEPHMMLSYRMQYALPGVILILLAAVAMLLVWCSLMTGHRAYDSPVEVSTPDKPERGAPRRDVSHGRRHLGSARSAHRSPAALDVARRASGARENLERTLEHAERREQLCVEYQPIVDVRSGKLAAVEALLRLEHPERGRVMPEIVIPSAERTGLILSLGEWVLRRACQDLQYWQSAGHAIPTVAVNVSGRQVMAPRFAQTVARILEETGADPNCVYLEITESVYLADLPRACAVLGEVKDLGIRLSLDDFGTGYSSLSYLREFPFDVVKVGRNFIAHLPTDAATRSIVGAIIDLSHILDLRVTVEGVETAGVFAMITDLGADDAQGFHISKPLTSTQLADYANNGTGLGRSAGQRAVAAG